MYTHTHNTHAVLPHPLIQSPSLLTLHLPFTPIHILSCLLCSHSNACTYVHACTARTHAAHHTHSSSPSSHLVPLLNVLTHTPPPILPCSHAYMHTRADTQTFILRHPPIWVSEYECEEGDLQGHESIRLLLTSRLPALV